MKKCLFLSAIVLAAFTAFIACSKNEIAVPSHEGETIELMFNAGSPNTRTEFGTNSGSGYPVTWSTSDEAIKLAEVLTPTAGDASSTEYTSTGYALSNANATAVFSANVAVNATEGTYDYHAIYPSGVYQSTSIKYSDVYVKIPQTQTPTTTSPDRAATVLYASSTGHSSQPTSVVNLSFSHITAYGKMTVKNASSAFTAPGETISSVTVSVPTGGIYYYWKTENITAVDATKKDNVIIQTTNLDTSGDFVAWFACAPYSLAASEQLTVSVTTDANTYSRTITLSDALTFESGKVSKFSVDMSSAVAADNLSGNYLIVSTNETDPWHVMTYDVSNNYYVAESTGVAGSTSLTLTDASVNFSSFCVDVNVWTLAKATGGYSLKNVNTGKYVTLTANDNKAHASNSEVVLNVTDNGSNVFTVQEKTYSRTLQYNYNGGTNPRFAFYSSAQKVLTFIPVSSYKLKLKTPASLTASAEGSTVTVSWGAVEHAASYVVTCTNQANKNIPFGTNSTTFTGLSDGNYSITVTAVGDGATYVDSAPASTLVSVSSIAGTDVDFVVGTDFNTQSQINNGVLKDGITLKCNTTAYYNPLRIYSNNTVTASAASGKKIVKVVITGSSTSYIKTWSASDSGSCTISGSTMTWTKNSGLPTITFTQTASAQARVTQFTVTYIND